VNACAWVEIALGIAALGYAIWYYLQLDSDSAEVGRAGALGFAALGLAFVLAGLALRSHRAIKWLGQLLWLVPVLMILSDLIGQ